MQYFQKADVAHLDADPMQRSVCAEQDCPNVGPLASMQVWRVYRKDKEEWKHFAFCSHQCVLVCLPVNALPKG